MFNSSSNLLTKFGGYFKGVLIKYVGLYRIKYSTRITCKSYAVKEMFQ